MPHVPSYLPLSTFRNVHEQLHATTAGRQLATKLLYKFVLEYSLERAPN